MLAYVLLLSLLATPFVFAAGLVAVAALAALIALNAPYYRWFVKRRGWAFAARVVPAHILYHLCNGVSFVVGTAVHLGTRIGIRLPGALPEATWPVAPVQERATARPHSPLQ